MPRRYSANHSVFASHFPEHQTTGGFHNRCSIFMNALWQLGLRSAWCISAAVPFTKEICHTYPSMASSQVFQYFALELLLQSSNHFWCLLSSQQLWVQWYSQKTRKTVDWYSVWNWVSVAGFRILYNISWKGTMISVRGRERGREIFQNLIIAKLVLLTLHGSTS